MAAVLEALEDDGMRRERVFRDRTNPLDLYDDVDMFKKYRYNREGVMFLIDLLHEDLEHATKRTNALPAPLQVFVALRFYATGSVMDSPASLHGVSLSSCSRVLRRVTQAICAKKDRVSSPTPSPIILLIIHH